MVIITGDCHGDWRRFSTRLFPEQKEMTRDDFVIVCGDFGIWDHSESERWWLNWLNDKPFTTLFVDGNHENFNMLNNEFEEVDFHGGRAHKIRDNIYHLMRGYVFNLCGKSFFAFGGARSHDISDGILRIEDFDSWKSLWKEYDSRPYDMIRVENVTWWRDEMPNDEEMSRGLKSLEKVNFNVDYIVSHCCPTNIIPLMFKVPPGADKLTNYFDHINNITSFKRWYFGHYHDDMSVMMKYRLLYHDFERCV